MNTSTQYIPTSPELVRAGVLVNLLSKMLDAFRQGESQCQIKTKLTDEANYISSWLFQEGYPYSIEVLDEGGAFDGVIVTIDLESSSLPSLAERSPQNPIYIPYPCPCPCPSPPQYPSYPCDIWYTTSSTENTQSWQQ